MGVNSNVIFHRRISFGKHACYSKKRINEVEVVIELRKCGGDQIISRKNGIDEWVGNTPTYTELSICGNIWNNQHTDIVCGGQCLDEIIKYVNTPRMQKIHALWKRWHLNGTHAGTPEQEEILKRFFATTGGRYDYDMACAVLKNAGKYEVLFTGKTVGREYNHEPYKYGHGWVIEDLPEWVIKVVKEL